MSWDSLIGHQEIRRRFQACASKGRLAGTYLFLGPNGIGKRAFALKLAEAVLCERNPTEHLTPCGECSACLQVQQRTHPDLLQISKPADKNVLPIDLFIGRSTHRKKEGLVYEIGMKPYRGGYRIAIIDDADYFNAESSNCLLKTLEEPPPQSILILLGTSQQRQLHTIVSRSQLIRFQPLQRNEVADILHRLVAGEALSIEGIDIDSLAASSSGSISRAIQLADPETFEFRKLLFRQLASIDPHQGEFAKSIVSYAEAAGKEGFRRRPRLELVGEFAIELFRTATVHMVGSGNLSPDDSTLDAPATELASRLSNTDHAADRLVRCIQRTGDMQFHVSTNAQFLNVVESWLVDLGRLMRHEPVTTGQLPHGRV